MFSTVNLSVIMRSDTKLLTIHTICNLFKLIKLWLQKYAPSGIITFQGLLNKFCSTSKAQRTSFMSWEPRSHWLCLVSTLQHDIDAGVLKKVILAEDDVVTVKGARSVSLWHPLDLPLPLNRTNNGLASGLLALAEWLRQASSRTQSIPLLSLRIVGPSSPTTSSSSPSSSNRLKLKRLAPGLVQLSSTSRTKAIESFSSLNFQEEATSILTRSHFVTMWPLASINGSNLNLLGFETLLASVLGPKANKKGSFKLLKADVSVQTFVKIGFAVEKNLKHGDSVEFKNFPDWRTKP